MATTGAATAAQLTSFRQALKTARHPVALAGAGLSAASGIPTFRGAGGLWRSHDALQLATPEAFRSDASKVWQFYHTRRETCLRARPNAAHEALAFLSTEQGTAEVFPAAAGTEQGNGFHFITQNVDGLSIRANDVLAGMNPRRPIEMHGSLFRVRCTSCGDEHDNVDSPICEALRGTEAIEQPYRDVELSALPRCTQATCDGGLLRPAVVWFGEGIPTLRTIDGVLDTCDLLLVLGTSATVYPAAGFASLVRARGGRTAVFNVERSGGDEHEADWYFEGGVEETLPWALGLSQRSTSASSM